jgi:serine phosphatase RsbU (regulator of sigma subunit)
MGWFNKPKDDKGTSSEDFKATEVSPPDGLLDGSTVVLRGGLPRPQQPAGQGERVHYLVVVAGREPGRRIQLGAAPITIGRIPPADVVFPDQRVSRSHCRVAVVREEAMVTDLGSTNGTFIDGKRTDGPTSLPPGARLEVGSQVLTHESRSRKELEESEELDRDLANASRYVQALLPTELADGAIRTEWILLPSKRLGGDAFGYHWLDANSFAIYLVDVSGHGAGAALHAVSLINVLRQQALPRTDFRKPVQVVNRLNAMFQMDRHGNMYATLWYGVYDLRNRTLAFCSAGHHPGFLVPPERNMALPLATKNIMIGAVPDYAYKAGSVGVSPDSRLYVFSDGVFEITTRDGKEWGIDDFVPLLLEPVIAAIPEPKRLHRAVLQHTRSALLEDDFSMVVVTFP